MKKIFYILIFLIPFVAQSQTKVIAPVEPNNTSDTYPTHRDIYGQGGLMTVTTWAERNAISTDRRKLGMLVRVVGSGVDSTYTLVTDLTNASWVPYATETTGSFVTTNTTQDISGAKTFLSTLRVGVSPDPNIQIGPSSVIVNNGGSGYTSIEDGYFQFANASGDGQLSSAVTGGASRSWVLPNASGTIALTSTVEAPLTFSSPLSRSTNTISIPAATSSVNGYLTSANWTTFNNKASTASPTFTGTASFDGLTANSIQLSDATYNISVTPPNFIVSNTTNNESITVKPYEFAYNYNSGAGHLQWTTLSTGASRTINLPDASGTIALTSGVEVPLTFSSPLSRASNTISIPAAASGVSGYVSASSQTFSGEKTFADFARFTTGLSSGTTSYSQLEPSGITVGLISNSTYTALNNGAISSRGSNGNVQTLTFANASTSRSVTVPDLSGEIILGAGTQTLSGEKTFTNYTHLTKLQTSDNAGDSILVHSDFDDVIKLAPANYVTLSGNQDVAGMKTFTNGITIEDADGMFFEASPNTSEGGYEFLTRNTSTGLVEKLPSSSVAVDANVVHLAGTESVTGIKTFTDARIIDNGSLRFNDGANSGFLQNATLAESVTWTLPDRDGEVALKNDWFTRAISTKTSNYTLTVNDHYILVDASGGNVTITVPAAASTAGQEWVIKRIDSSGNTVTIDPNSSETIDGDATATIGSQWGVLRFVSNGTNLFKTM